ncbi:hemin-degrading factor [Roseovarius pelagicus]|uniref:Hemin-degrading factor n=1 Tax=Roseovarius pelagicus TaxID=2980108 RepID=A0ABY6D929_9RHOB|nr:ChuX/HutX family heme-like substrate-binding protein [Roseovarius pelagicus]UXX82389.1 hemin-degrading factor [Roseovarius pelagicus]
MADPINPSPVELSPEDIRAAQAEHPKLRDRDLATKLGISEAQLVAASCGITATRIDAHPDRIMGAAMTLGEVMALTRNESCVSEKVGTYEDYHPGNHAAMVLTEEIDLRIFPSQWKHAFMVEKPTDDGPRRSLQVFDAAGDAVHKIFLRSTSQPGAWDALLADLPVDDQSQALATAPRKPTEPAKSDMGKVDILRKEWMRMTDTHQFMRLTSKLKMNRLGAYRIAGAPLVRPLAPQAVNTALEQLARDGTEVMIFVGNRGCIQIHTGPVVKLHPMGPWQNVMDPRFNLHLRLDHVAEVWAVDKPTQRGPAMSLEAFDADGGLIFQIFGVGKEGRDSRPEWRALVGALPDAAVEENV